MLINTTLSASPEIMRGLMDGTLKRCGGVVRDSGTGRIVKHLVESPNFTRNLINLPSSPITSGARLAVDAVGQGITINKLNNVQQSLQTLQGTASSILGMSQIAAGASILNLGVSIAGFLYMNHKLDQLRSSINNLQTSVDEGFSRIDNRLDVLSHQLGYIQLIVQHSRQEQQVLSKAVTELHRAILIQEIANLQAELHNLSRFPDSSPKDSLKATTKSRIFLSDQALQVEPNLDARSLMISDVAIQGWAASTATEVYILLDNGLIQEAKQVIDTEVPRFRDAANRWAKALLKAEHPELSTAYRFADPKFRNDILPERVERIARISPADSSLSKEQITSKKKDVEVEFDMSYSSQYDESWKNSQIGVSEYLDSLSELADRLESVQAFANLCEDRDVKSSRELLPPKDTKPEIYII